MSGAVPESWGTDRRAARRRAFPGGFVGMLLVIVAVELGLSRLDRELTPLPPATWRHAGEQARIAARGADLLCFGDSLVKVGVMPPVLEGRLGLKTVNLAVLGGTAQASYLLFRRALDAGATPRGIVLNAKANILMWNHPRSNLREFAEMIGTREALDLAASERDLGFLGHHLIHRHVPSIRLRAELRKAVIDAVAGRATRVEVSDLDLLDRQAIANQGGMPAPVNPRKDGPDPYPDGKLSGDEEKWCYPAAWYPRPANLIYLDRILALAASRGIDVYFVLPPIHPGVQAQLERRGLETRYLKLLTRIVARYPRVFVIDAKHAGFPHGEFIDPVHLDRRGAAEFSRGVADAIAERLRSPGDPTRWSYLRRHAETLDDRNVEDLAQSRVVLEGRASTRR